MAQIIIVSYFREKLNRILLRPFTSNVTLLNAEKEEQFKRKAFYLKQINITFNTMLRSSAVIVFVKSIILGL